jgi:hypothetical protein
LLWRSEPQRCAAAQAAQAAASPQALPRPSPQQQQRVRLQLVTLAERHCEAQQPQRKLSAQGSASQRCDRHTQTHSP